MWCSVCKRKVEMIPVSDNNLGIRFVCPCGTLYKQNARRRRRRRRRK